jgi:ABC-2 type transport system permease protein
VASAPALAATPAQRTGYRLPQFTVARFIGRHSAWIGAIWGLVFGLYVYDNAFAFDTIAKTAALRTQLLTAMGRNAGLKALLGDTQQITSRGGFTDWRAVGVITLVASVWGLLAATKAFRGDEAAGRWEMFLAGQTTHRRAAANALAGLGAGVLAMYLLTALLTALVGARRGVGISPGQSLFFGLAVVAGAAMFVGVGAVTSQLMATRARAAGAGAAVLGAAFMLRALGDTTSSGHWLVYLSPLGWVEQLHPLTGPHPVWLLPIGALAVLCAAVTVLLSGRDLGTSVLAGKDTATARTAMLGSPALFALRLSWAGIAAWLAAAVVGGALYGSLAKTTGEAFASSGMLRKFTGSLTHATVRELQLTGARLYAGVVFLILMTLIMAYVATAMGRVREDEAEGYLDNLVVRRVSRQRWLAGRAGLILAALVLAGLLGGVAFWAAAASGHAGLGFHELLLAGINAAAPAALLLGVGLLALGFVPRLTSIICWGLLAWAFLLDMLGSAVKINHWLMDTSLLYHPALAPAVSPNWRIAATYLAGGAVAALIGGWRFTRRDLQSS